MGLETSGTGILWFPAGSLSPGGFHGGTPESGRPGRQSSSQPPYLVENISVLKQLEIDFWKVKMQAHAKGSRQNKQGLMLTENSVITMVNDSCHGGH